jgi:hypothetical protein
MGSEMRGQWQGKYTGYSTGDLSIQIDEYDNYFSGRACVFEAGNNQALYVCEFRTSDKSERQQLKVPVRIQRFFSAVDIPPSELSDKFPEVEFPTSAVIEFKLLKNNLRVSATTYRGDKVLGSLSSLLTRGSAEKKSKLIADRKVQTWKKFKQMVGDMERDRYIFRGQSVVNRIRTSFHRTNRRDLYRFMTSDIPQLHGVLTSKTKHYFDLSNNIQTASFWNLLQHHGYPTPLLDWTHSPYVAAYFAFREKPRFDEIKNRKIRIFMFDRLAWESDYTQIYSVINVYPHFSLLNPVALENPRALPQQAICSITTVDDVEGYLDQCGRIFGKTYLRVFELPFSERDSVLSELRLMGVAAGSLFPGIDGACEEMKLRNFQS